METDVVNSLGAFSDNEYYLVPNFSCNNFYLPSSIQLFEGLGNFGVGLVTVASVLCAACVYLAVDACSNICYRKESQSLKINACAVLSIYPIASLCSLTALALPRAQLLSEGLTQVSLTISLYRLFELLVELGLRGASKAPTMALKVGPCCCWPCLPMPASLEMTEANLSWLRLTVLQFPIVQGLIYCILLFMSAEAPIFATSYGRFFQPIVIISILLGIYGLTVVTKSLQHIAPAAKLPQRTIVAQLVLLFSKLQGFLIKSLVGTGLFPCNPPLTPLVYANVTYDALMVIEMLLLCYAARLIYAGDEEEDSSNANNASVPATDQQRDKSLTNGRDSVSLQIQQQQQQQHATAMPKNQAS